MENTLVETKQYSLIKGEFAPEDAMDIMMELVGKKINFHVLRDWSHQERFGTHDGYSAHRIVELKQTKSEMHDLIKKAERQGKTLRITATVRMEIMD